MFNYDLLSNKWIVFCLLALAVFAVFGQAIWFDYVQLDEGILLINNNFFISKLANFTEVFKHDINYPSAVAPYYRPIFVLSFMLNSQFDKLMAGQISSSPLSYHVGNILLHIVAVFFVFGLLRELGIKRIPSTLFSVLFAIHPAVTPVVAWVPGRIEAILAIFTLLSFIMFIRFMRTSDWRYLMVFFLSFAIALFTKEVAISLLPVLIFYYLMHRKEKGSEMLVTLSSGLVIIILAWFFVRRSVLIGAQIVDLSFFEMLAVLWSNSLAVFIYLGKTLLPLNLTALPVLESSTLIYGFIALAAVVLYWFFIRVKILSLSTLGLLWFIGFLAPSLVSYNASERMIFFEHRLYLPLIGILIFFASSDLIKRLDFKKLKNLGPALVVIILFSFITFNYSGVYKDKMSFWQKAVADSPQSFQAHNGLATAYLTDGKTEEAIAEFTKTLEINPEIRRVHLLLGLYYLDQGRYDEAKTEFEKEIKIDPQQFVAYHGLGRIYAQDNNLKEAEKYFLKTLEFNVDYVLARQDIIVLYFSQGKHPQAIAQLKELLKTQRPEAMHPQILEILEVYSKESGLDLKL
ncbi:MAG: tetratricopeptide repeat protein [bacterium]|nr:tetratricopeptide repeat protein [bacterium]